MFVFTNHCNTCNSTLIAECLGAMLGTYWNAALLSPHRLVIPGSSLLQLSGSSYTVTVTLTTFLNATASASWTWDMQASGAAPVIVPLVNIDEDGGRVVPFRAADGVKVPLQLMAASVCAGSQVRACSAAVLSVTQSCT